MAALTQSNPISSGESPVVIDRISKKQYGRSARQHFHLGNLRLRNRVCARAVHAGRPGNNFASEEKQGSQFEDYQGQVENY